MEVEARGADKPADKQKQQTVTNTAAQSHIGGQALRAAQSNTQTNLWSCSQCCQTSLPCNQPHPNNTFACLHRLLSPMIRVMRGSRPLQKLSTPPSL